MVRGKIKDMPQGYDMGEPNRSRAGERDRGVGRSRCRQKQSHRATYLGLLGRRRGRRLRLGLVVHDAAGVSARGDLPWSLSVG